MLTSAGNEYSPFTKPSTNGLTSKQIDNLVAVDISRHRTQEADRVQHDVFDSHPGSNENIDHFPVGVGADQNVASRVSHVSHVHC